MEQEEDDLISKRAEDYARTHKKEIAFRLTNIQEFPPDEFPVSVFMAGSPGAGKTESSKYLIEKLTEGNSSKVIRIDTDDLRSEFSGYNGKNSSLFMGSTSIIADKMQDYALKNKQSFIFDGTFANFKRSKENIERSLEKKRFVEILYVYQDPLQAWEFVKAREIEDGRYMPKDDFIKKYFLARENVNLVKKEFGKKIQLDLIIKNSKDETFSYYDNVDNIDNHIPEKYTTDDLESMI